MKKQINQVREFNTAAGRDLPTKKVSLSKHTSIDPVKQLIFLEEELKETTEALHNKDLVEVADGIGDMLYVIFGLVNTLGLDEYIEDIFEEIHNSNMSKFENGQPILKNGKVQKGKNYFKPRIVSILMEKK